MLALFQTNHFARFSTLVMVFATLLLAGCINAQSNVALYGSGQWSGVQTMSLAADFVQMMESSGQSGGELTTETEGLDKWVQQAQSAANRDDLNVTFEEVNNNDGSRSYVLRANGQGFETLNEVMFQGQASISEATVDGQRRITIMYDASQNESGSTPTTPAEEEMSAEMMQTLGLSIINKISGGEIISSNADRVEGGTAIWETPKVIEITLTEAAELKAEALVLEEVPTGNFDLSALINAANELDSNATSATDPGSTAPQTATEQPTEAVPQSPATSETTQSTDPAAAAPTSDDQALPTSGGILPQEGSAAPLVLGALVLMALVGAGAFTSLQHKK